MNTNTTQGRWSNWMDRARTCFKAVSAIDATATKVNSTLRELNGLADPQGEGHGGWGGSPKEVVEALKEAEAALVRAREAVQAALKARQLTAANREVAYGLVG